MQKNLRCLQNFLLTLLVILISNTSFAEDTLKILTISEGLRLATDNNRLIKIASFNKNIASSDILISRAKLLPSINASQADLFNQSARAMFGQTGQVFISQKEYFFME
jgi:hypothetical protein